MFVQFLRLQVNKPTLELGQILRGCYCTKFVFKMKHSRRFQRVTQPSTCLQHQSTHTCNRAQNGLTHATEQDIGSCVEGKVFDWCAEWAHTHLHY